MSAYEISHQTMSFYAEAALNLCLKLHIILTLRCDTTHKNFIIEIQKMLRRKNEQFR